MVTKGGTHVVVVLKAMWHVNLKALLLKLQTYHQHQTELKCLRAEMQSLKSLMMDPS